MESSAGAKLMASGQRRPARTSRAVDKIGRIELGVFVTLVIALITLGGLYLNARSEVASLKAQVRTLQADNNSLKATVDDLESRSATAEHSLKLRTNIVTWAYQQCRMSTTEIQRIDPTFKFPLGTSTVGTQIVYPQENAQVPPAIDAEGTLCGTLPKGSTIWIALVHPGTNGYYPQGSNKDRAGPVTIRPNNTWVSASLFVGGPNDRGSRFDIATVLANPQATASLWTYLRQGERNHSFPPIPLPLGAHELSRLGVDRK